MGCFACNSIDVLPRIQIFDRVHAKTLASVKDMPVDGKRAMFGELSEQFRV